MIRYQIRNEYGLSDPEVYATGENDPEALLEGVAMAGLVGVLRQLGDLAEFAAEIFHDLHEDVMATSSRGHGLMLRLKQLEAEFPAVEKAIIAQTNHSSYPYDDGVEWHANLHLNQNMITQGDMPRFILDSYEECHGPPRLFTLDKFDVAGAGACLKRYSDPSFFKMEHVSNMIETDAVREMKPRKIKKKAIRWRKGETLESFLVANSESQTASKERGSRKVPPRTTKLKSRRRQDSDCKSFSKLCREHLQEVISSQQKNLSDYSARQCPAKFRLTDSSETASLLGDLDNFGAFGLSSAKLELTKVVPINDSDIVEAGAVPINGSDCQETDDGQHFATRHAHAEVEGAYERSLVVQNEVLANSENLQEGPESPDLLDKKNNFALDSSSDQKLLLAAVPAGSTDDRRPDDVGNDQDNFVDALNGMESEAEVDPKTKRDLIAKMETDKLDSHNMEGNNMLQVQFLELDSAINSPPGLSNSNNSGQTTCAGSFSISDSAAAMSTAKDPTSGSVPCGQPSDGNDWANQEPFRDVDLMDVSSSSSLLADENGDLETHGNLDGHEQYSIPDEASVSCNNSHVVVAPGSEIPSCQAATGLDGFPIDNNNYTEKTYDSEEHGQNLLPDDASDDFLLQPTIPNQEELLDFKKQDNEDMSSEASSSPVKLAEHMRISVLEMKNDVLDESITVNTTSTCLEDPDGIVKHLDELDSGVEPISSKMLNQVYESHDSENIEELSSLPDNDLVTPIDSHVAEDQKIVSLETGAASTSLELSKEDPMDASIMPGNYCGAQELQEPTEAVSPPQDGTEVHIGETLVSSNNVLREDSETLLNGAPVLCSASALPVTSSFCVEHLDLPVEVEKFVEHDKVLVDAEATEESSTFRFASYMIPSEEDLINGAKHNELLEVVPTNSMEENSECDIQLQGSSACRDEVDTVEDTRSNLRPGDESREHACEESILQMDNLPQHIELEIGSNKGIDDSDDIQYPSSMHIPLASDCLEELLEESRISAEVLCQADLDKDDAVNLKSNMVEEQPRDVDQEFVRELAAQDSFGTNPFMDLGYLVSPTQANPLPSMSYQPCSSEEDQDFLSEVLLPLDDMENLYPAHESLWEPATPPDEAALPSEVMTEEDFRSFCHEYHEIDLTAVTKGLDDNPASDSNSNDISNDYAFSELDLTHSVCVLPVGVEQESCVCSKSESQFAPVSSVPDIPAEALIPLSAEEDLNNETSKLDSDLRCCESLNDNKILELEVPAVPVELEQENHVFPRFDSHSGLCLLDNNKIGDTYVSRSSNTVPVKDQEACALDEHDSKTVPHSLINENIDELNALPLSNAVLVAQEPEARASSELEPQIVSFSSINETIDEKDVPPLSKAVLVEQKPEIPAPGELVPQIVPCSSVNENIDGIDASPSSNTVQESEVHVSGELDSQIVSCSSVNENIDEFYALPLGNAVLAQESEARFSGELDSQIVPCFSISEKIGEVDIPPLSNAVLVEQEPEAHVSGELDSQTAPCSSNNGEIDELDVPPSTNVLSVELEQETHVSPEMDSRMAPCSLNDKKDGEIDEPPSCNIVPVELGKGSCHSPEFDSQTVPCSSSADVPAEASTMTSNLVVPSSEEAYQLSSAPPPIEPLLNVSFEDPEKPPPLPPLQWRLGRPRLGLLNTRGHMPENVRTLNPFVQTSSADMDNKQGSLNRVVESIDPLSSEEIKERYHSLTVENNDQKVETPRLSTVPAIVVVGRAEHDQPFSDVSEYIKHPDNMSLAATEDEKHLNDLQITEETALHLANPLPPFPIYEHGINQQYPASEDEKVLDDHDATGEAASYAMNTLPPGNVSQNCKAQQLPQYGKQISKTSEHKVCALAASDDEKHLNDQFITSGAPSHSTNLCTAGASLEDSNSQQSPILQKQNVEGSQGGNSEGSLLPNAESKVSQCLQEDRNSEREKIQQPSPFVVWSADKSNYVSGLHEDSCTHVEQLPVMGWTVGPQMLHPNYAISMEDNRYGSSVTDHWSTRKPYSIRNIPRNPLVDAVAAHDRSTMRKVSELAPPIDKPKPNGRNLLLEQIRSKTFSLKPVSAAKPTTIRAPTRNLKVAAIIEKANAIRQAVGSDEEDDGDNWSDT